MVEEVYKTAFLPQNKNYMQNFYSFQKACKLFIAPDPPIS